MAVVENTESDSRGKKSILLTGVVTCLSLIFIYLLIFPWTGLVTTKIAIFLGVKSIDQYIIYDALVSFLMLCIFFLALKSLQKVHANFVILFCAFCMFMFWGIESEFFINGLNESFPVWYEINMAMNDIVAALIAIFTYDRLIKLVQERTENLGSG